MMTSSLSGILVPGGFGQRGTEGKISAVKHARERKIPYLGLFLYVVCMFVIYWLTMMMMMMMLLLIFENEDQKRAF